MSGSGGGHGGRFGAGPGSRIGGCALGRLGRKLPGADVLGAAVALGQHLAAPVWVLWAAGAVDLVAVDDTVNAHAELGAVVPRLDLLAVLVDAAAVPAAALAGDGRGHHQGPALAFAVDQVAHVRLWLLRGRWSSAGGQLVGCTRARR